MAQAEPISTTRREFYKWLAAIGAAAASPVAIPVPASAIGAFAGIDWSAIGVGLAAHVSRINVLDCRIAAADKALAAWEARNPWPVEPEYDSRTARIDDFERLSKAQAIHAARYQNALKQCGRGALKRRRLAELDSYAAERDRIADIRAPTLDDVKAKSRLAMLDRARTLLHSLAGM